MDKAEIASILVDSETRGGIPVFLTIDEESVALDLRKVNGVLFCGAKAEERLRGMATDLSGKAYDKAEVETETALRELYEEFVSILRTGGVFSPPRVILLPNVDELYSKSQEAGRMFREILCNGLDLQLYFLACASPPELPPDIAIGFSVKVEPFYSAEHPQFNAVFDFVGTRRRIRLS